MNELLNIEERRRDARAPMTGASVSRMSKQKNNRQAWVPVPDWHSRGYLPHCGEIGHIQNVTFRLSDSVPEKTIADWRDELGIIPGLAAYDTRNIEFRRRISEYEDAGHGGCLLGNPQIAELVQNALLFFDGKRYRVIDWCIMPNHVHVLVLPVNGHLLANIVHSWKSYTGHMVKKLFNLTKPFWMVEYHDRFIRNERHLEIASDYIRLNPVSAGLVRNAEDWPWSSATRLDSACQWSDSACHGSESACHGSAGVCHGSAGVSPARNVSESVCHVSAGACHGSAGVPPAESNGEHDIC